MIKKRKTLKYIWNDKHKTYMKNTQNCAYNIAEGSIRSGKTTDNVFCFAYDIKHSKDKIHLATASTQPTAKLIIGDCDGFGLEHIFRGQCRWGKYKGNECLFIEGPGTAYKEKIVLFCGGAKADSYKKFRGATIGLWIATEINLHHENTIQEALKRQIKADAKRLYWDLNPENPSDPIYTEYIDKWQKLSDEGTLLGGYNYQSFNIFDNVNIPKKNLDEVLSRYTVGDVFYIRDILGERCAAEGVIYKIFIENTDEFLIDSVSDNFKYITVGLDYGATKGKTVFIAAGIGTNYKDVTILDEYIVDKTDNPEAVYKAFDIFYKKIMNKYKKCQFVFADWGGLGQVITGGLDVYCRKNKYDVRIRDCSKGLIIDRIELISKLVAQKRFKILKCCVNVIQALKNAVWDEKAKTDARLDNNDLTADVNDAIEYSIYPFNEYLIRKSNYEVDNENNRIFKV